MLEKALRTTERFIPTKIFRFFNPAYHWTLAFLSALSYRFPSREIKVIAVTGTKGKSSTTEIVNAILEEAGYKTALSNTIRFKIDDVTVPNKYKMSMPGRFFAQRFIREAVNRKCDYLIMEMTSQGSLLYRHRFIELDTLVFTNISPEHIEAHGSYENYRDSKVNIARNMERSSKTNKAIIANSDDKDSSYFLRCKADKKITYGIKDVEPFEIKKEGLIFSLNGRTVHSHLSGLFNLYNILAAITTARNHGISEIDIIHAIEKFENIPGRVQKIVISQSDISKTQDFNVIVDYAHTPDSLEKFYSVFKGSRNICILGGTGGGRDVWKRTEMGRIADENCQKIILTDEDPYDENPRKIVDDVAKGIRSKSPIIIMDRREAIREAIRNAESGDNILITGKGTDPYIMGPNGTKIPWSDAEVVREELKKFLSK